MYNWVIGALRIQPDLRARQFSNYITLSIIESMISHALTQRVIVACDHCPCATKQSMPVSRRNSE